MFVIVTDKMAEGGVGRGRGGRGAIIAKLLEMQNKPGQPPAPPAGDGPSNEPASVSLIYSSLLI